ncbi:hypothetical protein ACQR1W_01875 [Bradyrhizobium sp. HKCCYLS1011]|uniref:hypothetical protein n=1 Tax=Bradyrhizobium sp. HKCCYLS1011 TaxID=3420733 RepID=UPI003EBDF8DD
MVHRTRIDSQVERIEAARAEVERAMAAYSKNGDTDRLNRAQRQLADAYERWRGLDDGRVRDDRR